MSEQKESALSVSWWSSQAQKNLAIVAILALALSNAFWVRVSLNKDEVISECNRQIIKCEKDGAATIERLMTQSQLNGQKSDNVYGRQSLVLDNLEDIKMELQKIKKK